MDRRRRGPRHAPAGQGGSGRVSLDGTKIALTRESDIYTITPTGKDEEFVSRGDAAQWLAESRHLLVFRREGLVSVDIQDDDATVLVRRTGLLRGWSESPDGTELAYALAKKESRSGECGEYVDIYVVDRDGGSRRRHTRWAEQRPGVGRRQHRVRT